MGLREIEVFRAVMTAGTTSKAAGLLGISQPAVSQSIRKLETTAGLRLFERIRGRLVPTQEALALMGEVDRYFTGFEVIEHRIRSLRSHGLGRLAIAVYPALGNCFMPRAIAAFCAENKNVQISLQIMSSREVHHTVSSGQVDFGLMADEMPVAGLEHSSFVQLSGVVVMAADHPLATHDVIKPADLQSDFFVALNPEDSSRRQLENALCEHGIALRALVETPYSNSVCELALRGIGLGLVNPLVAIDYVERGLVLKPLSIDIKFSGLLVFRSGRPLSENAKQFLSAMRMQLSTDVAYLKTILKGCGHVKSVGKG